MKVLVLGGTGMLGSVVVRYLISKDHNVTFTVRDKIPSWMPTRKAVGVIKFDVKSDLLPSFEGYDFVINCIGNIKQKEGLKSSDFYEVNAVFPWKLALACKKANVKLIHISSDCVFKGDLKPGERYIASAPKDADDDYGISKALGEPSDTIVVRTSIIGPADTEHGLFEWFRNSPKQSVPGFNNHIWSGVTTLYLAQYLERFIFNKSQLLTLPPGMLVQLASAPITKYDLLVNISNVFCNEWKNPLVENVKAPKAVNRALLPSNGEAPNICDQLCELREWMKEND